MRKIAGLVLVTFFLISCSLKYEDVVEASDRVPELVFQGTEMTRYEDKKISMQMKAEILEQYKSSSETYAKNVEFISYEDGELSTDGSCGFLFMDTDKELYELYDDIRLFNHKDNMNFFAEVLKWNAKNEQLTSGRGDIVSVQKDDTTIRGNGFSASGVSKSFSFRGNVTGTIITDDNKNSVQGGQN